MRIRSIKPEFWTSQDIADLSWDDRLLFVGLWSYVDDNGVGRDVEKLITADLFALEDDPRETLARVSRGLQKLSELGRITRYTIDGRPFIHITNWLKHQRIDKPAKERYPLPTCENAVIRGTLATVSRDPLDTVAPGTGEQRNRGTEEQVARKRATQRPSDWKPNQKHIAMAAQLELNLDNELEQFTDYHDAKGSAFKDWDASFRSWLRNAAKWGKSRRNPYGKQQETDDLFDAAYQRALIADQNQQELTS